MAWPRSVDSVASATYCPRNDPGSIATSGIARLRRVFDRAEAASGRTLPLRRTKGGIWAPTPFPVIEAAVHVLRDQPDIGDRFDAAVVDAGTGDGRVAAVLARCLVRGTVYGIERDVTLCARAVRNLEALEATGLIEAGRVRIVQGSYDVPDTYRTVDLDPRAIGMVMNYPDGNQDALARFLEIHGSPNTHLCLLSHNPEIGIARHAPARRIEVVASPEPPWHLSVYEFNAPPV